MKIIYIDVLSRSKIADCIVSNRGLVNGQFDPETEPFAVLSNLSKVTGTSPLDRQMESPLLLSLYPFFNALLILNKLTHNSGTYLTSFRVISNSDQLELYDISDFQP